MDRLLTTKDVQKLVPSSRQTLENRIEAGEFPRPIKIGRLRYWREDTLRQWLDQKAAEVAA